MNGIDISKLMSIIAEHPELVESIKSIAEGVGISDTPRDASAENSSADISQETVSDTPLEPGTASEVSYTPPRANGFSHGKKRQNLLCAIKPYVSPSRAAAIDTMLSLFDIINLLSVR